LSTTRFTCFYPSPRFCAGDFPSVLTKTRTGHSVELNQQKLKLLHTQVFEEVLSVENECYTLKVLRDGCVLLRVNSLEDALSDPLDTDKSVIIWNKYLNYLNTLFLLLDSSAITEASLRLHEITTRDVFRASYENGNFTSSPIVGENTVSVFHLIAPFSSEVGIRLLAAAVNRVVLSLDYIKKAVTEFGYVVDSPGLERTTATLAKSISEYKVGSYEICVVLSWFVIEEALNQLWKSHLDGINNAASRGKKRINSDRMGRLTGRDYPISVVSNLLELWGYLPITLFRRIERIRQFRNRIVHRQELIELTSSEANLALVTSLELMERVWRLSVRLNSGHSVLGFGN